MPEIKAGPDGGWSQAFCHYCGWASQSKAGWDRAMALNAKHERRHPEWTEPPSLESIMADIDAEHAAHDCKPADCVCICGCRAPLGCTVTFGPLCSTCMVRDHRGDDEHGEPGL